MKKISFICFGIAILFANPFSVANANAQTASPPGNPEYAALFLFGRASYFHAIVDHRRCDLLDAGAVEAINQRFANAREQLAQRYGEKVFPANKPNNVPVRDAQCDRITINAYSNHVSEIEQFLATGALPPS